MDTQFPKVVVGCFILNSKNEILLVKSYKWPNLWVVMGGHIEWGEKIGDTVKREAKEEVGLDVEFDRVVEVAEFVFDPHFHKEKHFVALQSLCHIIGDQKPKIDNDEIQEARWFSLKETLELKDLLPVTHHTIQKLIDEKSIDSNH